MSVGMLSSSIVLAGLTVEPITWDVVGLDHNRPLTSGPELFPVGARVCSDVAISNAEVELIWEEPNAYVDTRPGSLAVLQTGPLAVDECFDAYFEIQLIRDAAAFGESRRYRIEATDDDTGLVYSSPTPRAILIEQLVSQNRNTTTLIRWGQQEDESDWQTLGAGGGLNFAIGETYFIELTTETATAYEQLESFLTLSNTIFQVKSVETTYGVKTAPDSRVPVPNPRLYADGCLWEPDVDSPNYNSCLADGKAGGTVVTRYEIDIISGGGSSVGLLALIYDRSGSSFHYNTDFSQSPGDLVVLDPTDADFSKRFIPDTIGADGVSTLRLTITNPNPLAVSGYEFTDSLPGNMVVASPANLTNGCGGTATAAAGSGTVELSGGTLAANASCSILVDVTVPFVAGATYPVVLSNSVDLFIGGSGDPSATADADLTVTEEPPPPLECQTLVAGSAVAGWTSFDNAATPIPTFEVVPGIASASGGGGLAFALDNTSVEWQGSVTQTGRDLTAARAADAYYEFVVDTTGLVSMDFSLEAFRRNGNAPESITLDYGPVGSLAESITFSPVPTQNSRPGVPNFIATGLANLNASGDTVFRVYAYGASNSNQPISLLDVSIDGEGDICGPADPGTEPDPPELSKAFSANPVRAGESVTLSFTVSNPNAADALSGVTFRDELPAGMTATGGFVNGCGGSWGNESGDPGILLLENVDLAAGASCVVSVDVSSTQTGTSTNVSDPVDAVETFPGNSALAELEVLPPPQAPSLAKTFDGNPLLDPAGFSTLTFSITNNDPALDIASVAFTDPLPVGMEPADSPLVFTDNGQCGASPTLTYDSGANTLSFSNGEILAGQVCEISIDIVTPGLVAGDLPAIFDNQTSTVSHVFEGVLYEGNDAEATLLVDEPIPDVAMRKEVGFGSTVDGAWSDYLAVEVGDSVYYKLTVENIGETELTGLSVSDPNVDTTACTWTDPLPTAEFADPEAHIDVCIIGPVSISSSGVFPNTATADANGNGTAVSDVDDAMVATAAMSFDKQADRSVFDAAGEVISYSFVVTNTGSAVLSGPVAINDPLITDALCPDLNTVGNNNNFFDPGETLNCSGTYTTSPTDVNNGQVVNTAFASTPEIDSPDDSATVELAAPALVVAKTLDSAATPIEEGSVLTYSVTATNTGNITLNNVVVSDPLLDTSPATCATVAPGADCVLTGTYTVTQSDVDAGQVTNTGTGDSDETPPGDDMVVTPIDQNPGIGLSKVIDSGDPYSADGDTITYTITATNNGNVTLSSVSISDPDAVIGTCTPAQPTSLAPGETLACAATYSVTQADVDNGSFTNTATVEGSDPDSNPVSASDQATASAADAPALSVVKMLTGNADEDGSGSVTIGDTLSYTVTATNDGNITLTNVVVSDPMLSPDQETCVTLAPGADCVLSGTYTVTQSDVDAGQVTNTGAGDSDETPPEDDTVVTPVDQTPGLDLLKEALLDDIDGNGFADVGEVIDYTLTATNTGNVTLTDVVVIDDLLDATPAGLDCLPAQPATLLPGEELVCTGSYEVTQADVDAGDDIVNEAASSAPDPTDPNAPDLVAEDTTTTPIDPADALIDLVKTISGGDPYASVGDTISYELTATNNGNVTLTAVSISDPDATIDSCTPAQPTSLAPGETLVCAATYAVDQNDIDAGSFTNTATVDATDPDSNAVSASDSATANASGTPALSVVKTLDNAPTPIEEGSVLTYSVTATNTGNITLNNVVVSDPMLSPDQETCVTLAPGADCVLSGTYTVTQSDVDAGQVTNTGTGDSDETPPGDDTVVTPIDQNPGIGLSKVIDSGDPYSADGDTITYTITATNSGNVTLTAVSISDPDATIGSCTPAQPTSLAPGATLSCAATYSVTQADVDNGSFTNTATVEGSDPDSNPVSASDQATASAADAPALSVVKTLTSNADEDGSGSVTIGDTLSYTVTATNDGNVTLNNVLVSDPMLSPDQETCATLAPGADCVLSGTYTVTQGDMDAGQIENTGTGDSDETPPEDDTVVTQVDQNPGIDLVKAITGGDPYDSVGDTISYELTATNTGNVTLTAVSISDPDAVIGTCTPAQPTNLAPGETLVCAATYSVTQAAVDNGSFTNTATVEGSDSNSNPVSATDSATANGSGTPGLSVVKTLDNAPTPIEEGSVLTYSVTATNTGNVTLNNVVVTDPLLDTSPATCATVVPGDDCVLTGTYTVTQSDVDGGQVSNTGTGDSDETPPEDDTVVTPIDSSCTFGPGCGQIHPVPGLGIPGRALLIVLSLLLAAGVLIRRRAAPVNPQPYR